MIQKSTLINIADSSGVSMGRTIQVFRGFQPYARIGSLVRLSIHMLKRLHPRLKIRARRLKKIIFKKRCKRSTIVRTKYRVVYLDGRVVYFKENAGILYKRLNVLAGRRVYGITTSEVGNRKVTCFFSLVL